MCQKGSFLAGSFSYGNKGSVCPLHGNIVLCYLRTRLHGALNRAERRI
jgi:hypothetical protein